MVLRDLPMPVTMSVFCGAGGESLAQHEAFVELGVPTYAIEHHALNHWNLAVHTHRRNLPWFHVYHEAVEAVSAATYGLRRITLLHFSASCTHHSRARGGKPRDDQQRSHPWEVLHRWLEVARVDVVTMENVTEIMEWGPIYEDHSNGCNGHHLIVPAVRRKGRSLGRKAKYGCLKGCHYHQPIPEWRGLYFVSFVIAMEEMGYRLEYRTLNSADFGAPTSRTRFFMIARRDGAPIVWPEKTHRNPKAKAGVYDPSLPTWRPAADCIDWSDLGTSIFERKRPLAPATCKRIAAGLVKYVLNGRPFLIRTDMHQSNAGCVYDPADPLRTVTTGGGHAVVSPYLAKHNGPRPDGSVSPGAAIDGPMPAIVASGVNQAVVSPFLAKLSHGTEHGPGVQPPDDPLRTQTGQQDKALVAPILVNYRGTDERRIGLSPSRADEPMRTITGGIHEGLVAPVLAYLRGTGDDQIPNTAASVEDPARTVSAGGNHAALVAPFLAAVGYGERAGQDPRCGSAEAPLGTVVAGSVKQALIAPILASIDQQSTGESAVRSPGDPLSTMTTKNRHAVVAAFVEKGFGGPNGHQTPGASLHGPMPAVTTRDHSNLVAAFLTEWYSTGTQSQSPGDPLHTVTTLARHGLVTVDIDGQTYVITDIRMRMLEPRELAKAMGFPDWYEWLGPNGKPLSKRDATKMIGNACEREVMKALTKAVVMARPEAFGVPVGAPPVGCVAEVA